MSIRFAAPPRARACRMLPGEARARRSDPANDTGEEIGDAAFAAALRLFARYGLAAAGRARRHAETALHTADADGYRHWLEVCRALDRRMARDLARTTSAPA